MAGIGSSLMLVMSSSDLVFDLMDENDNKLIPFHIWLDGRLL
jgi:hypothetical protein